MEYPTLRVPKTQQEKDVARQALDRLIAHFGSRNIMARELGLSRNTITWWCSRGYVGRVGCATLVKKFGFTLDDIRPDLKLNPDQSQHPSTIKPEQFLKAPSA